MDTAMAQAIQPLLADNLPVTSLAPTIKGQPIVGVPSIIGVTPEIIEEEEEKSGWIAKIGKLPLPILLPMAGLSIIFTVVVIVIIVVQSTHITIILLGTLFPFFFPGALNYRKKDKSRNNMSDPYGYGRRGPYGHNRRPAPEDEALTLPTNLPYVMDERDWVRAMKIQLAYDKHTKEYKKLKKLEKEESEYEYPYVDNKKYHKYRK